MLEKRAQLVKTILPLVFGLNGRRERFYIYISTLRDGGDTHDTGYIDTLVGGEAIKPLFGEAQST